MLSNGTRRTFIFRRRNVVIDTKRGSMAQSYCGLEKVRPRPRGRCQCCPIQPHLPSQYTSTFARSAPFARSIRFGNRLAAPTDKRCRPLDNLPPAKLPLPFRAFSVSAARAVIRNSIIYNTRAYVRGVPTKVRGTHIFYISIYVEQLVFRSKTRDELNYGQKLLRDRPSRIRFSNQKDTLSFPPLSMMLPVRSPHSQLPTNDCRSHKLE